ncbi:glycosyltransferase family 39 protein [Leptolyngbya sp. FACHB-261]|uniref:ArnT family glycosyltransferase n=1 Tax=Leptolyngbya sp. FACHB-261 TaxID=2692806 RepID=UPI001683B4B2|nr:glycosyltransferase family 39 protein [Leptolyngbya sp. FACHB-261]MBD2103246.1 glycosyltransferase family 39 protein [Leptolyngbya sp. FACHB-261]
MHLLSKTFAQRFWLVLTVSIVSVVLLASLFWVLNHPYATTWDEAAYINRAYEDVGSFQKDGLYGLAKSIMGADRGRPPANRLLALPVTLLAGVSPILLRLVSLSGWALSLGLIYLAAQRLAGPTAGAFASLWLALCPIAILSSMRFYTEFSLFLAISAMLFFLFQDWNHQQTSPCNWIGLGLALGAGTWAKPTFILIAGPVILLALLLSWRRVVTGPEPKFLLKALALAGVVAAPWWLLNAQYSLGNATRSSTKFVRHSMGSPSLETWAKWLIAFVQTATGPALAILAVAILLNLLLKGYLKQGLDLNLTQKTALWLCCAGSLPLLTAQLFATNHNLRLVSPSLLPLAIGLAVIAATLQWTQIRLLALTASVVFCTQLFVLITPTLRDPQAQFQAVQAKVFLTDSSDTVLLRREQWDWSPLRQICLQHQIQKPVIAYIGGNGGAFNLPQIRYPWVEVGEAVQVEWLWRYELGEIDWQTVTNRVNASDVVLTAPTYVQMVRENANKDHLDNQHNFELAHRLETNSNFQEPIELEMGQFEPVKVLVFIRQREHTKTSFA